MKSVQICLNTFEKVCEFVKTVSKLEYELELVSDKYVIDAKSLMGIFSLDLTKTLCLNIYVENHIETIIEKIASYIV